MASVSGAMVSRVTCILFRTIWVNDTIYTSIQFGGKLGRETFVGNRILIVFDTLLFVCLIFIFIYLCVHSKTTCFFGEFD